MRAISVIFLTLPALLLGACTPALQIEQTPLQEISRAPLQAERPDHFWWQLRFKLVWPDDEQPDFSRHLLIAEQLILPEIIEHEQQLPLWRFHRRAGRDNAGHQFSLIFFSDETSATSIHEAINANPLTRWLVEREMIEKTKFQKRSTEELGRLENTSDPDWPIEVQRSWPWFIMGASQSWLTLVTELSSEEQLTGVVDYPELLKHYKKVDVKLTEQWQDYGQRAYLHHLSAIFGYQPITIWSSESKTF